MTATTVSVDPPVVVGTGEAARLLGISEERVRWLARTGRLAGRRVYERGSWKFRLDDIERLAAWPREAA